MFCTGVTLFALVLHLNCTALSQSESRNFFMCIINEVIHISLHNMNGYLSVFSSGDWLTSQKSRCILNKAAVEKIHGNLSIQRRLVEPEKL